MCGPTGSERVSRQSRSATGNSGSGGTPTGNVQFQVDGNNYGSPVTLDGNGQASTTDSAKSAGGGFWAAAAWADWGWTAAGRADAGPQAVRRATTITAITTVEEVPRSAHPTPRRPSRWAALTLLAAGLTQCSPGPVTF